MLAAIRTPLRPLVLLTSLALAMAITTPAALQAAELKVKGTTKVTGHAIVKLELDPPEADSKAAIRWRICPNKNVSRAESPRGIFQFTAPPGQYTVTVEVIRLGSEGQIQIDEGEVTVTVERGRPGVGEVVPQPPPAPSNPAFDVINAIVRIRFGDGGCTATIIGPRRADGKWDVLTAAHCVSRAGARGTMRLNDGRQIALTAYAVDTARDIAWLVTNEQFESLPCARLADNDPPTGAKVWHRGWGTNKPGSHERGVVNDGTPDAMGWISLTIDGSPGDSGAGIFDEATNDLVAVLWGGNRREVLAGCVSSAKAVRAKVTGIAPPATGKCPTCRPPSFPRWGCVPDERLNYGLEREGASRAHDRGVGRWLQPQSACGESRGTGPRSDRASRVCGGCEGSRWLINVPVGCER